MTSSVPRLISSPPQTLIPEHAYYEFIFSRAAFFKRKAFESEQQGRNAGGAKRFFHRQAGFDENQAQIFDAVATELEQNLTVQDAKAQQIIYAFRARFPKGVVPRGQVLPPPPPELQALQEERNAMILRARDQLYAALGENAFRRFDNYVKSVTAGIPVPRAGSN